MEQHEAKHVRMHCVRAIDAMPVYSSAYMHIDMCILIYIHERERGAISSQLKEIA